MTCLEEYLIEILSSSVKKNGEIPLTNLHLLNIMRMVNRQIERDENQNDAHMGYSGDWD